MSVPFIDLHRDLKDHRDEYLELAARVLDSGAFSLGKFVQDFESAFATYLGAKEVVALDNGTSALYAALLALDVGPGDEVIVPANSFIATAEAVWMTGADVVYIDIDSETQLLDTSLLDSLRTERTKAVIPVHLNGFTVDIPFIMDWAKPYGIFVIEDTAQAQGSEWIDGRKAGALGDIGCFSFYPTKNLGAHGEAGCIATNDSDFADRIRALRAHGSRHQKYLHEIRGMNLKMSGYQGAVLTSKLQRLDDMNDRRRSIAGRYQSMFSKLPISLPPAPDFRHVYYVYTIRTPLREELRAFLADRGIGTGIYYPVPIPDQPVVDRLGLCPVSTSVASEILSLPMFPDLTDDEVDEVIASVMDFFKRV